jgi:hypothetical protein
MTVNDQASETAILQLSQIFNNGLIKIANIKTFFKTK